VVPFSEQMLETPSVQHTLDLTTLKNFQLEICIVELQVSWSMT